MADYPTSVSSFSTKAEDEVIDESHVNLLQDEIVALQTGLLSGIAHDLLPDSTGGNRDLGATGQRFQHLWLDDNADIDGTLDVAGAATLHGAVTHSSTLTQTGVATMGAELALADNLITRPYLQDWAEVKVAAVTVSGQSGAVAIDYEDGNNHEITMDANITSFTISNWPATGRFGSVTVWFKGNGTGYTQSWGSVRWPNDSAPTMTTTNGDYAVIVFFTFDAGTTVFGLPVAYDW